MWKYPKDVLSDLMNDDFSNLIRREIFFTLTGEELIRFRLYSIPSRLRSLVPIFVSTIPGQRTETDRAVLQTRGGVFRSTLQHLV